MTNIYDDDDDDDDEFEDVTSGFRRDVDIYDLLGCHASYSGNSLPTFRSSLQEANMIMGLYPVAVCCNVRRTILYSTP